MAKLPRKPKAPKTTASLSTWENFKARVKDWEKKINQIKSDKKKKENIIKSVRK